VEKEIGSGAACSCSLSLPAEGTEAWKRPDPELSLVTQATFSSFEEGVAVSFVVFRVGLHCVGTTYCLCPSFVNKRDKRTRSCIITKEKITMESAQASVPFVWKKSHTLGAWLLWAAAWLQV